MAVTNLAPAEVAISSRARHVVSSYGYLPGVWLGFGFTIIANLILKGGLALIVAHFAAAVFAGDSAAGKYVWMLFLSLALAAALNLVADYAFVWSTDRQYAKLVGEFYDRVTGGSIWSMRSGHAESLRNVFRNHLDGTVGVVRVLRTEFVPFLSACGIPALILGYFDWQIGLLVALVVMIQVWFAIWSARHVSALRKKALKTYNALTSLLFEHLRRLDIMRVADGLVEGRTQVVNLATEEARLFWRRHRAAFAFDFVKALLAALCFAAVFWLIDRRFSGTPISPTLVLVTAMYLLQSMQAAHSAADLIARLSEKWSQVGASLAALASITPVEHAVGSPVQSFAGPINSIELRSIVFAHQDAGGVRKSPVFNELSLRIDGGSHISIVGDNGSGKTTLLHLLLRFDGVQSGSIAINGVDINKIDRSSYYRALSYAPSGSSLLSATVRENISLFDRTASDERVSRAAAITGVSNFLEAKGLGLDSIVGNEGQGFSAGEQQRIVLARALLRAADLYLFDEATSALDEASALEIVSSIRDELKHKTVVFITHSRRLAAVFPRTLVCEGGCLAEMVWSEAT